MRGGLPGDDRGSSLLLSHHARAPIVQGGMDTDSVERCKPLLQSNFPGQPDVVLVRQEVVAGTVAIVLQKQVKKALAGSHVAYAAPTGIAWRQVRDKRGPGHLAGTVVHNDKKVFLCHLLGNALDLRLEVVAVAVCAEQDYGVRGGHSGKGLRTSISALTIARAWSKRAGPQSRALAAMTRLCRTM